MAASVSHQKNFENVEFYPQHPFIDDHLHSKMQTTIPALCTKSESLDTLQSRELEFIQLPEDLLILILLQLPIKDILKMRINCLRLQNLIDTNQELQSYIAYQSLEALQPKCNIPMGDLKAVYTNGKFSVEVNNNLCLWKLTTQKNEAFPKLNHTLLWISHIIINSGKSQELIALFNQLKENRRLTTVYLLNCEANDSAMQALSDLQTSSSASHRAPYFYLCNLKTSNCESPSPSTYLSIIDPNKASDYSIEKFVTTESDRIDLNELSKQVENDAFSNDVILEKLESLNSAIKMIIITSIWHSTVMPTKATDSPISTKASQRQVSNFVNSNPHHPALSAAINQALLVLS